MLSTSTSSNSTEESSLRYKIKTVSEDIALSTVFSDRSYSFYFCVDEVAKKITKQLNSEEKEDKTSFFYKSMEPQTIEKGYEYLCTVICYDRNKNHWTTLKVERESKNENFRVSELDSTSTFWSVPKDGFIKEIAPFSNIKMFFYDSSPLECKDFLETSNKEKKKIEQRLIKLGCPPITERDCDIFPHIPPGSKVIYFKDPSVYQTEYLLKFVEKFEKNARCDSFPIFLQLTNVYDLYVADARLYPDYIDKLLLFKFKDGMNLFFLDDFVNTYRSMYINLPKQLTQTPVPPLSQTIADAKETSKAALVSIPSPSSSNNNSIAERTITASKDYTIFDLFSIFYSPSESYNPVNSLLIKTNNILQMMLPPTLQPSVFTDNRLTNIKALSFANQGANSTVCKAKYNLSEWVAVKKIPINPDNEDNEVKSVCKEVALAIHAQTADVTNKQLGVFIDKDRSLNILTTWCNEGSLENYLIKLRVNNPNTQKKKSSHLNKYAVNDYLGTIIREIALPIAYKVNSLHKLGISHLNLKLANILLHKNEKGKLEIYLCDFGSSGFIANLPCILDKNLKTHQNFYEQTDYLVEKFLSPILGEKNSQLVWSYLEEDPYLLSRGNGLVSKMNPPEAFKKGSFESADLWCFGMILLALWRGFKFDKGSFMPTMIAICDPLMLSKELPFNCPPDLKFIIEKCSAYEPSQRFTFEKIIAFVRKINESGP